MKVLLFGFFAIFLALSVPLLGIGYFYTIGWLHYDAGFLFFGLSLWLGGGFISAAVWLSCKRIHASLPRPLSLVLLSEILIAHYLIISISPSPEWIWSRGVIDGISSRLELTKLQKWGEEVVHQYERQELKLDGKCPYYANGNQIDDSEIPA